MARSANVKELHDIVSMVALFLVCDDEAWRGVTVERVTDKVWVCVTRGSRDPARVHPQFSEGILRIHSLIRREEPWSRLMCEPIMRVFEDAKKACEAERRPLTAADQLTLW